MNKSTAVGALIGITLGIITYMLLPTHLRLDFMMNTAGKTAQGLPTEAPLYASGSIYSVGYLIPIILGFFGALIGSIVYKIRQSS